jgi:hypothetical protein
MSIDSCANQKMLDSAVCFGNNCSKRLHGFAPSAPLSVAIQFTDNKSMPHTAFTRTSIERLWDTIFSPNSNSNYNWRNSPYMINRLSKDINIAEVAKAFYIDKTIEQKDIQL